MRKLFLVLFGLLFFTLTNFAAAKVEPYPVGFNISITKINEDRVKRATEAGIHYIEVGNVIAYLKDGKDGLSQEQIKQKYRDIKALLDQYGMQVWSIHMPFRDGMDASLLDEEARAKVVATHKEILQYVAIFNPKIILIHPGSVALAGKRDEHRAQSVKTATELLPCVEKIGAKLVVENMLNRVPKEGREATLCCTLEDMKILIAAMPKNVYVAIDVNHAKDPQDYIAHFGERVKSLHISDCDKAGSADCHFLPGDGSLDFVAIMTALNNAKYQGVYLHELGEDKYNKDYNFLVSNYNNYYQKFLKSLK